MVIRFSSIATESIIMLGDTALPLIRMMGASGSMPGALYAADIPDALMRLRSALRRIAAEPALAGTLDEDADREDGNPDVPLAVHALPLIDLLERASLEAAPVMWEETKAVI